MTMDADGGFMSADVRKILLKQRSPASPSPSNRNDSTDHGEEDEKEDLPEDRMENGIFSGERGTEAGGSTSKVGKSVGFATSPDDSLPSLRGTRPKTSFGEKGRETRGATSASAAAFRAEPATIQRSPWMRERKAKTKAKTGGTARLVLADYAKRQGSDGDDDDGGEGLL